MARLAYWFTLEGRVSRRSYALTGFGLMALKYAAEAAAIQHVTGSPWTPLAHLSPLYLSRMQALAQAPRGFLLALGLWSLPFAWIGASMTLRRALDAGWNPWTALAFFVPGLNYVLMLALACAPSAARPQAHPPRGPAHPPRWPVAAAPAVQGATLLVIGVTAFLAVAAVIFGTLVALNYGLSLFVGVPVLLGVLASFLHNRAGLRTTASTLAVVALSLGLAGVVLLLFALEGVVCIAMALPLVLPFALGGALLGRALTRLAPHAGGERPVLALALPLCFLAERALARPVEVEVVSALEIEAPPERVWPNVIGFGELPAPSHWLFATGIAYPLRATLEGEGVGAVRRCEFSTGAFVEPITAWEPPTRLAFDVVAQPLPMEEWSFYGRVRPPHLERSFRSLRGEFRLVPLPGGRTRLEGRTWYALELAPFPYWRLLADAVVGRIHRRVLEHVAALSEGPQR